MRRTGGLKKGPPARFSAGKTAGYNILTAPSGAAFFVLKKGKNGCFLTVQGIRWTHKW
jgi:hypothetical protein